MVKIAIIGAGLLGIKIAGEMAYYGHRVKIHDVNIGALNSVYGRMENDKEELRNEGLLLTNNYIGPVLCMSRLEETVNDADFIFECVIEDLGIKNELMERITYSCKPEAIICTNSLRLKVDDVFCKVQGKERCIGLRFLYPVFTIPEVELTPCQHTSQRNVTKVREMLEKMGKVLFFRSGTQPLILSEQQREERKKACLERILNSSGMGCLYEKTIPSLTLEPGGHGGSVVTVKETKKEECAICMERSRNSVICPCHHLVACYECTKMLLNRKDACPICRKDITEIIRVYHS